MSDLLGPASAANTTTVRPADSRTFGSSDTWAKDATSPTSNDGTAWSAACFNGILAQIRSFIRGAGIAVDNTNDSMLLQAAQSIAPPYAVDTGSTPGTLIVNVNQPGFSLAAGKKISVKVANTVPGATTIQLSNGGTSIGTYNVTRADTSTLCPYDLVAGQVVDLPFDGTEFQVPRTAVAGTTGDIVWALAGVSKTGYVPLNGLTIGSAASSATALASALAQPLYTFLWNSFSNTLCPVTGGRGATAAADFAANKPLQLPDWQCKTVVGVDGMGGASATGRLSSVPNGSAAATAGATVGEATHSLSSTEIPSHQHNVYLKDPGHTHTTTFNGSSAATQTKMPIINTGAVAPAGSGGAQPVQNTNFSIDSATTGITIGSVSGTASDNQTAATGGGGAHNTTQLSVTAVAFARL